VTFTYNIQTLTQYYDYSFIGNTSYILWECFWKERQNVKWRHCCILGAELANRLSSRCRRRTLFRLRRAHILNVSQCELKCSWQTYLFKSKSWVFWVDSRVLSGLESLPASLSSLPLSELKPAPTLVVRSAALWLVGRWSRGRLLCRWLGGRHWTERGEEITSRVAGAGCVAGVSTEHFRLFWRNIFSRELQLFCYFRLWLGSF